VTSSTTAVRAAHAAAPNVPIVSWASADPIRMGWAQTLARSGGLITGLFLLIAQSSSHSNYLRSCDQGNHVWFFAECFQSRKPAPQEGVEDAARVLGFKVEIIELK
jgi:hypothetical protein